MHHNARTKNAFWGYLGMLRSGNSFLKETVFDVLVSERERDISASVFARLIVSCSVLN